MHANFECKRQLNRAGHTLLELLLVLAILAIVLSVAIPTYESMISERRLHKSAETLELVLHEARVKAMRTGQSQVFKYTLGSGNYTCTAWLDGNDDLNSGPGATLMNEVGQVMETSSDPYAAATTQDASKDDKNLDEGIQFASANTAIDSRANYAEMESNGGMVTSSSPPIMFYPDGTATTAEIVLQNENGSRRVIQIRGLTGRTRLIAGDARTTP